MFDTTYVCSFFCEVCQVLVTTLVSSSFGTIFSIEYILGMSI